MASMSNQINNLVPELRFPEFKNSGNWITNKLGKLGGFIGGGTADRSNSSFWTGDIPWISSSDISEDDINNISITRFINEEALIDSATKAIPVGSVLFVSRVGVGKLAVNKTQLCTSQDFINFIPSLIQNYFIGYYFLANKHLLQSLNQGTSIKGFLKNDLVSLDIPYPNNQSEQKKIASCFSSLDELITAEQNKLLALGEHKKGLIQSLFPQEAHKIPNYRFSEFENTKLWEESTIGATYQFQSTNSFSRENLNYEKGKIKNIHYGDIHTKFNTLFDIQKEKVPFINDDISIANIKKESYCVEADIIFADASEDLEDIGKCIEIVNLHNQKLLSGLHTLLARQRNNKIIVGFGGYLFKSYWVRKQIKKESQGTKVLGISATRLSSIEILYPSDTREQQKIASCLSSLDALITAQVEKIAQLRLHKKGLMQGLFPKMND